MTIPPLLPAALLLLLVAPCRADPFCRDRAAFVPRKSTSLLHLKTTRTSASSSQQHQSQLLSSFLTLRGGATLQDEEEEEEVVDAIAEAEEDDEEEESESEDEEEEVLDAKLAAAALKSASKAKAKQTSARVKAVKTAVNTKLSESLPAKKTAPKKKLSLAKAFKVPYILRAAMNPFTVFAMTKAYWASLFNLDYLQKNRPAQELRSALEEKAKRNPSGGGSNKGRRKMKRGQAKTLADLPQLNT